MNKKLLLLSLPIFLSLSILFLTTSPTFADNDPIDPVFNTETGNYYQFVQDIGISWNDAESNAEELYHNGFIGRLAVITTQDENDFITDLLPDESSAWIGLSEYNGEYEWINEETFDYSNWSNFQPTNGDYENYVELFEYNGKWNDTVNGNNDITGYIVEYNDEHIDPIYNPETGNYYQVIMGEERFTWEEANNIASGFIFEGMTGHLVTITSESEKDFINDLIQIDSRFHWIGLNYNESEGVYEWVTGETYDYTDWHYKYPKELGNGVWLMQYNGWFDRDDPFAFDNNYYIIEFTYNR